MTRATAALADHPHVSEVPQTGMILAVELVQEKVTRAPYPWQDRRGRRVYRHALERGTLLRPLAHGIYFMRPDVISEDEIDFVADVVRTGIDAATA